MIADIAFVFHWPLSELLALHLEDLIAWHEQARPRIEALLKTRMA